MTSDVGEGAGMLLYEVQILLAHLPDRGVATREQGWVVQVTLYNRPQKGMAQMEWLDYVFFYKGFYTAAS